MVKRILGGILFICIGIFLMIASIKMIFVDDPKAKKLLSEAVYVTTDTVDPANDGKAVIVSAPFKLVEPAYDDEMGLVFKCRVVSGNLLYSETIDIRTANRIDYGRSSGRNYNGSYDGIGFCRSFFYWWI